MWRIKGKNDVTVFDIIIIKIGSSLGQPVSDSMSITI